MSEPHSIHATLVQAISPHILLLDGNDKQRFILNVLLKTRLKYYTTEHADGNKAIDWLEQSPLLPDLILFDISTTEGSIKTIEKFKALMPEIPIIALVKYGDYQWAAEALLAGAFDFLTKPVAEERMKATLQNSLRHAFLQKELALVKESINNNTAPVKASGSRPVNGLVSLLNNQGEARSIQEIEQLAIQFAVQHYNGRMTQVARKLGIGRSTLYRKLDNLTESA